MASQHVNKLNTSGCSLFLSMKFRLFLFLKRKLIHIQLFRHGEITVKVELYNKKSGILGVGQNTGFQLKHHGEVMWIAGMASHISIVSI